MKLSEVLEPAIELAERGFVVTPEFARSIERSQDLFQRFPSIGARISARGAIRPGRWFRVHAGRLRADAAASGRQGRR